MKDDELFLLGAGASKEAGLPDVFELTGCVEDALSTSQRSLFTELKQEILHAQPTDTICNFEEIYFRLEERLDKDKSEPLLKLKRAVLEVLKQVLWLKDKNKIGYLQPLCLYCGSNRSNIVTLNWDNAIELAFAEYASSTVLDFGLIAKRHSVEVETFMMAIAGGNTIGTTYKPGFLPEFSGGIRVIKAHGSIDLTKPRREYIGDGKSEVIYMKDFYHQTMADNVVLGREKVTQIDKDPFLKTCFDEINKLLHRCSKLHVIGYSFNDTHINQVLLDWAKTSDRKVVLSVAKGKSSLLSDKANLIRGWSKNISLEDTKMSCGEYLQRLQSQRLGKNEGDIGVYG